MDAVCPFVVGVCGAGRVDVGTTATGVCSKLFEGVRSINAPHGGHRTIVSLGLPRAEDVLAVARRACCMNVWLSDSWLLMACECPEQMVADIMSLSKVDVLYWPL